MPTSASILYSGSRLDPIFNADDALASMVKVKIKASQTLTAGTVLGEVTASPGTYGPYSSSNLAAPVSAPTFGTAAGTDSTLVAGTYQVAYAYRNANGSTTVSPAGAAVIDTDTKHIVVSSITLPAGVTSVDWYMSDAGETDVQFLVNKTTGGTFNILALPAGGAAGPPASNTAVASVDGTQNPAVILAYPATTDGSGNITNPSEWAGVTATTVACYTQGAFNCADLTGLDANAVDKLGGHLVQGTVSTGIFSF